LKITVVPGFALCALGGVVLVVAQGSAVVRGLDVSGHGTRTYRFDSTLLVLGILLAGFICYMAIDAYRTAKAKMLGQPPPAGLGEFKTDKPIGPIILIVLGVLFLLGRHFPLGDWVREFWPVVFIALGVLLLWKRMGGGP
jgi:hypothetical protein